MARKKSSGYHLVHQRLRGAKGSAWLVYLDGEVVLRRPTKRAAFLEARKLAKRMKTSVRIHNVGGKILEERSYGDESKRPG